MALADARNRAPETGGESSPRSGKHLGLPSPGLSVDPDESDDGQEHEEVSHHRYPRRHRFTVDTETRSWFAACLVER